MPQYWDFCCIGNFRNSPVDRMCQDIETMERLVLYVQFIGITSGRRHIKINQFSRSNLLHILVLRSNENAPIYSGAFSFIRSTCMYTCIYKRSDGSWLCAFCCDLLIDFNGLVFQGSLGGNAMTLILTTVSPAGKTDTWHCPCPVAEWLERRGEWHVCTHAAGSKPVTGWCPGNAFRV